MCILSVICSSSKIYREVAGAWLGGSSGHLNDDNLAPDWFTDSFEAVFDTSYADFQLYVKCLTANSGLGFGRSFISGLNQDQVGTVSKADFFSRGW
tara:strand:+ start:11975 stop:12262 length:288 start_codon:yes stop_codon:yes gene_type:complete